MNTSEKLHEIKSLLCDKGDTTYEDYIDNVFGYVNSNFDAFVYQQLELVLTQFWNNENSLDETIEKIEDLTSSPNGKIYQQKLGMIRCGFDGDKFFKRNKYIFYIISILSILMFLSIINYQLSNGSTITFKGLLITMGVILILPYLFTYNAKKAKYKTNFIEIKDNICIYSIKKSVHFFIPEDRIVYTMEKVSKVDSNSKDVDIYGEIHEQKYIHGLNKVEPYKTIDKLKIPNYYKNIEEVITFISSKIDKS